MAFQHASEHPRRLPDVAATAVKHDFSVIGIVPEDVRCNPAFMKAALENAVNGHQHALSWDSTIPPEDETAQRSRARLAAEHVAALPGHHDQTIALWHQRVPPHNIGHGRRPVVVLPDSGTGSFSYFFLLLHTFSLLFHYFFTRNH